MLELRVTIMGTHAQWVPNCGSHSGELQFDSYGYPAFDFGFMKLVFRIKGVITSSARLFYAILLAF